MKCKLSWSKINSKNKTVYLFSSIKSRIRENIVVEKKSLEKQKQEELNSIKQAIEKEKEQYKTKLR